MGGPDALAKAARLAEELGFAEVWVSDHLVSPAEQDYPTPRIIDPLLTLAHAAAVTSSIGLGTSVLVIPQYHPLALANSLASLDVLSDGRLIVAGGVGWSQREYEALGQPFHNRGARMDEIIDIMRLAWSESPASFEGKHYSFHDIRVLPHPAQLIPLWIGGRTEAAFRRACERGDGFHGIGLDTAGVQGMVARVRQDRPDPSFTISLRTGWDPLGMPHDQIRRERDEWEEAGLQHVVSAPWRRTAEEFYESVETLARLVGLTPRSSA